MIIHTKFSHKKVIKYILIICILSILFYLDYRILIDSIPPDGSITIGMIIINMFVLILFCLVAYIFYYLIKDTIEWDRSIRNSPLYKYLNSPKK